MRMTRGQFVVALVALAFVTPVPAAETHDDLGIHDIMVPEPPLKSTAPHHVRYKARHKADKRHRSKAVEPNVDSKPKSASEPVPAPENKTAHNRKRPRGSSGAVYPAPLPPPLHYVPPPSQEVAIPRPAVPPPIVVPETGRVLPNFPTVSGSGPGGRETSQDRAVRCAHQAGVYDAMAGNRNTYIGTCINQ